MNAISSAQLRRAQVLFSQYARRTLDVTEDLRTARLHYASELTKREISSFSELTRREAHTLINTLQRAMGIETRPRDRNRARGMGTDGRRGASSVTLTMASQADLDRIQSALDRLGWTKERYEKWLASPSSPLRARTEIHTQADANRVWWALKGMIRREGGWNK